jgi:hypothetical protein
MTTYPKEQKGTMDMAPVPPPLPILNVDTIKMILMIGSKYNVLFQLGSIPLAPVPNLVKAGSKARVKGGDPMSLKRKFEELSEQVQTREEAKALAGEIRHTGSEWRDFHETKNEGLKLLRRAFCELSRIGLVSKKHIGSIIDWRQVTQNVAKHVALAIPDMAKALALAEAEDDYGFVLSWSDCHSLLAHKLAISPAKRVPYVDEAISGHSKWKHFLLGLARAGAPAYHFSSRKMAPFVFHYEDPKDLKPNKYKVSSSHHMAASPLH